MKKYIVLGLLVFGGISAFLMKDKLAMYWYGKTSSLNSTSVKFIVPAAFNIDSVANKLQRLKIIDDKATFLKVAAMKKLSGDRLAKGLYKIEASTSYRNLCNGFTKNSAGNGNAEVEVSVTFNNCLDLQDVGGKIQNYIDVDSADFVAYVSEISIQQKFDFSAETFSAMFIPNTYNMFYDTKIEDFVARMAKEFKSFWTPDRIRKLKEIGLESPCDAVTVASIVYQEQNRKSEEWKIIAGLYLTRLEKGMKMQSDPTFRFCWPDKLKGVERLLAVHREKDCPYNTYLYAGLPPGPICIPPSSVVDAVLSPDKTGYIFMCAKPDYSGLHDFAVDYPTHDTNAKRYSLWLAGELRNK